MDVERKSKEPTLSARLDANTDDDDNDDDDTLSEILVFFSDKLCKLSDIFEKSHEEETKKSNYIFM